MIQVSAWTAPIRNLRKERGEIEPPSLNDPTLVQSRKNDVMGRRFSR